MSSIDPRLVRALREWSLAQLTDDPLDGFQLRMEALTTFSSQHHGGVSASSARTSALASVDTRLVADELEQFAHCMKRLDDPSDQIVRNALARLSDRIGDNPTHADRRMLAYTAEEALQVLALATRRRTVAATPAITSTLTAATRLLDRYLNALLGPYRAAGL